MNLKTELSNYFKIKEVSKTTENYFQLEPQPKNTCPLIDRVIQSVDRLENYIENREEIDNTLDSSLKSLNLAIRYLKNSDASEFTDIRNALSEIESAISEIDDAKGVKLSLDTRNIVDGMEDIRSNCEAIRSWGQGWKDLFMSVFENPFLLFGKVIRLWFCDKKTLLKPSLEHLKTG